MRIAQTKKKDRNKTKKMANEAEEEEMGRGRFCDGALHCNCLLGGPTLNSAVTLYQATVW